MFPKWCFKVTKNTSVNIDTVPSYFIGNPVDFLQERLNTSSMAHRREDKAGDHFER